MSDLSNQKIYQSFNGLLQVPGGLTNQQAQVQDGNGAYLPITASTQAIEFTAGLVNAIWTDSSRPTSPIQGQQGYNATTGVVEIWTGSEWVVTGGGNSGGVIALDTFSGTGSQTAFTLSYTPAGVNSTQVYINGVYQEKSTYSLSSAVLNFTVAPPLGTNNVEVVILSAASGSSSGITYTYPATGAVTETVQQRLQQYVSVMDFGAKGDGVTDDTLAIQNAINSIQSGSVYVPSGTYMVNQEIDVSCQLIGESKYSSTIKLFTTALTGTNVINIGNNSSIENICVDVNNVASCIPVNLTTGSSNISVTNCIIKQSNGASQNAGSCISGNSITDFKIANNYLENALSLGVSYSTYHTIYLVNCNRGEINGNFLRSLQRLGNTAAILANNCFDINVHNNESIGGWILLKDGGFGHIDCNVIRNPSGDTGFEATDPSFYIGGTLNGNLVTNSVDNGLSVQHCSDISIIGNTSINNNTSGLAIAANAYRCSVMGNTFSNNGNQAFFTTNAYSRAGINFYSNAFQGNIILGNHLFDDQGTKTQQYGIANESTHSQLIGINYFNGNDVSDIYNNPSINNLLLQEFGINEAFTITPNVIAATGTITSYTATGSATRIGQRVIVDISVQITNAGTGAGALYVSTQWNNIGIVTCHGSGRNISNGKMIQVNMESGGPNMSIFNYDNSSVIATGATIEFSIEFTSDLANS